VAEIKLKIVGFPERAEIAQESTVTADSVSEIIRRVESIYPRDYYAFAVFLNGVSVDDNSRRLCDGDEVVVVPIMSGG